jgi:hypothetical protein
VHKRFTALNLKENEAMNIKCPNCGLTNFATESNCKRCKGALEDFGDDYSSTPDSVAVYAASPVGNKTGGRGSARQIVVVTVGLLLLGVVAVSMFVPVSKVLGYFNGASNYSRAITESTQFKSPVWVRANKEEIPMQTSVYVPGEVYSYNTMAGIVVKEVDVLAGMGYLLVEDFESSESGSRVAFGPPTQVLTKHHRISLTGLGQKEASQWEEFQEPLRTGGDESANPSVAWWRVPIGYRQFEQVTRVGEVVKESGKETLEIEFAYSWRPNQVGQAFDRSSPARSAFPEKARKASELLPWDSTKPLLGVAHLERAGSDWKVTNVLFSSEEKLRRTISYF